MGKDPRRGPLVHGGRWQDHRRHGRYGRGTSTDAENAEVRPSQRPRIRSSESSRCGIHQTGRCRPAPVSAQDQPEPEPKKEDGEKDGEKKEKAEEAGSNAGLIIVLCIVGALAIAGALWFFVFRSSEEDEELNADDCAVHEEC